MKTKPGQRVFEIGTGTGYNAALLAHRLGSRNVTSIEINPGIAEQARDDAQPGTYELLLYDVATESAATLQATPEYLHNNTPTPVRPLA